MAKIYVSSTFSDLKECRAAVYTALRKMNHDVIAMEDYVATHRRPLAKCLDDVETCEIYVGIFAWRYGFIPATDNANGRGITELEYRHALKTGKECLLFLLHTDAPWPRSKMEEGVGDKRIQQLREELGQAETVSFFHTPDELATLVGAAVSNWVTAQQPANTKSEERPKFSTDRLPRPLTEFLFGREAELQLLNDAWANPHTNIVSFHALAGAGKSALVSHWLAELAQRAYDGAARVFAWSFFSQGPANNRSDSSEAFLDAALEWFGETPEGSYEHRAEQLAKRLRAERSLLILDGLEPLQYPPNSLGLMEGALKDRPLLTLLDALAARQPGLCVITSREWLSDLNAFAAPTVIQQPLDQLADAAGAELLRRLQVNGTDEELATAVREFKGHAYGLTLLGSYLAEVLDRDIRRRGEIENLFEARFGLRADAMLAAYEKWLGEGVEVAILRMLGLFDRPAEAASIAALRKTPVIKGLTKPLFKRRSWFEWLKSIFTRKGPKSVSDAEWQGALAKLRRLNLLSAANPQAPHELDAHPLVREHFKQQLKHARPKAWRAGHLRLYEHLTRSPELPNTLDEMAPLYMAVTHGCEAGRHQEVFTEIYRKRIQRGDEFFSTGKLGAFGADLAALTNFFKHPWLQPVDYLTDSDKAFVLNEAGFCLRPLGRLKEAADPLKLGLAAYESQRNWNSATMCAGHLSQFYLTIGDLPASIGYAEQSVTLADFSNDPFWQPKQRATLARALHQAGRLTEAGEIFREAEEMQNKIQPQFPTLYSLWGFMYCDLLLDLGLYQEVQYRASQSLSRRRAEDLLLWIALDHLVLGRAYSLQAQQERLGEFTQAAEVLNQAVDMLRQSGRLDYLPRGLLARADLHRVLHDFRLAQLDLDEALRIAERGGMRLHLTDYHLEAARLALAQQDPATARGHWQHAQTLTNETGYHRRDGELAEIEKQWG
jgi:tetratricopeptide (TPR) repeat protein